MSFFLFFLRIDKGRCSYCFRFLNAMRVAQIGVFFFSFLAFKLIYSGPIIIIFFTKFDPFLIFPKKNFLICFSLIIIISFFFIFLVDLLFPF